MTQTQENIVRLRFDTALRAAGIPIDGVSGFGPTVVIDFRPEATAERRLAANVLAASFNWSVLTFDEKISEVGLDPLKVAALVLADKAKHAKPIQDWAATVSDNVVTKIKGL